MIAISIVFITIGLGLAIALLGYLLYKRHLDKVVSGEERDLHTKTVEPGTLLRSILLCVLAIWLLVSMSNIISLRAEVSNLQQQLNSQNAWIMDRINAVDSKLDAQNGITDNYWIVFKDVDPKTRLLTMEVNVHLKEYSKESVVSVDFGGAVTELTYKDSLFCGDVPVEIFRYYETVPVLTVNTAGIIQSQELDQCPSGYFAESLLPMLVAGGDDSRISYDKKGNLSVSGKMTIFDDGSKIEGLPMQSASIAFELDGEIISEIPLSFDNGVANGVEISGSFHGEQGQPFYICLKSVNGAGWTVIQRVAYYDWSSGCKVFTSGNMTVLDENGGLLFEERYDGE